MRKYGYIPDITDKRDYQAYSLVRKEVQLPRKFCWPWLFYDQDGTPACTCAGKCGVKSVEEFRERGKWITFDWLHLYKRIKEIDGIPEEGSQPRIVHKFVQKNGMFIPLQDKPDKKYRIKSYWRISSSDSIDTIKQIIFQFGPIEVGSMWYKSWEDNFSVFPKPDKTVGGHLYACPGWDDDLGGFVMANSWNDWGKYKPEGMPNGVSMAIMPYDMFTSVILPEGDVWKIEDSIGEQKCWIKRLFK